MTCALANADDMLLPITRATALGSTRHVTESRQLKITAPRGSRCDEIAQQWKQWRGQDSLPCILAISGALHVGEP